ncbi:MAG: helix-turn-helix transcriptional regulator [Verrucomicrobiota bacterium]
MKQLREARGVTQAQLTTLLQLGGWDLSRQVLAFVEDGSRILSDIEIFAILRALGHNPEILQNAFDHFCKQHLKDGRVKR